MRLIDIEDSLEPKSDSQKLEFLTPLEGGINSDGDVFIKNPSTNAPIKIDKSQDLVGTANYAPTYFFRVASNVDNASIYLNGENTFKLTPDRLSISVDDVIKNGGYTITIQKEGYTTNEKYLIEVLFTPKYYQDDSFIRIVLIIFWSK